MPKSLNWWSAITGHPAPRNFPVSANRQLLISIVSWSLIVLWRESHQQQSATQADVPIWCREQLWNRVSLFKVRL